MLWVMTLATFVGVRVVWDIGETPAVAKVTATPGPGVPGCWSGWSGLVAVGGETSVGSLPHGDLRRCLGHFAVAGGTPFQARLFVRWGTEILSPVRRVSLSMTSP